MPKPEIAQIWQETQNFAFMVSLKHKNLIENKETAKIANIHLPSVYYCILTAA